MNSLTSFCLPLTGHGYRLHRASSCTARGPCVPKRMGLSLLSA